MTTDHFIARVCDAPGRDVSHERSVQAGQLLRFDLAGNLRETQHLKAPGCLASSAPQNSAVVWGLAAYQDSMLFACVDEQYETVAGGYGTPNSRANGFTGSVVCMQLAPDGSFGMVSTFCGAGQGMPSEQQALLARPSGLCFDAAGNLYVTSLPDKARLAPKDACQKLAACQLRACMSLRLQALQV